MSFEYVRMRRDDFVYLNADHYRVSRLEKITNDASSKASGKALAGRLAAVLLRRALPASGQSITHSFPIYKIGSAV